jgi:hypothetical protein
MVNKSLIVSYIVAGISKVVFHNTSGIGDHVLAILGIVGLTALFNDGVVEESLGSTAGDDGTPVVHQGGKPLVAVVCIIS